MHTIEIPERNKTVTLPEHWDECTPDQALYILRQAFSVIDGRSSMDQFQDRVFVYLSGLDIDTSYHYNKRINPKKIQQINAMVSILAEQLCAWPFEIIDDKYELNMNTVRNMLPVIVAGGNTLYGPADLLSDLTFGEFRSAIREMDQHIQLAKDPDEPDDALHYLNRFVAALYRPLGADGKRTPFSPDNIEKHAFLAKQIPLWQKQTILLWFTYCVKYIQTEDIVIDGITLNLSALFPTSTGSTGTANKGVGWAGLLYDVAKEGVFGDIEKTDRAGLFDVLVFLYKRHLDNKELERKYKTKKK